jgi:NADPH-dependent 2,4-dienoyl-CoA reductase/sulfur reductase-like enzyme
LEKIVARNVPGRKKMKELTIIGGGLAGCEAAWQAAKRNVIGQVA